MTTTEFSIEGDSVVSERISNSMFECRVCPECSCEEAVECRSSLRAEIEIDAANFTCRLHNIYEIER